MNFKQIKPGAIALLVASLPLLLVGTYTDNGGFQLAGALILVVGLIQCITQAGKDGDSS